MLLRWRIRMVRQFLSRVSLIWLLISLISSQHKPKMPLRRVKMWRSLSLPLLVMLTSLWMNPTSWRVTPIALWETHCRKRSSRCWWTLKPTRHAFNRLQMLPKTWYKPKMRLLIVVFPLTKCSITTPRTLICMAKPCNPILYLTPSRLTPISSKLAATKSPQIFRLASNRVLFKTRASLVWGVTMTVSTIFAWWTLVSSTSGLPWKVLKSSWTLRPRKTLQMLMHQWPT